MKKFKFKAFILIIMFLYVLTLNRCTSDGGNRNPEQFGKTIFETFKSNSYTTFSKYIITTDDLKNIAERSTIEKQKKEKLFEKTALKIKKLPEVLKNGFEKLQKKAVFDGIKWDETSFVKTEYKIRKYKGIESSDIYILLKHDGLLYKIKLNDCVNSDRGWMLADFIRWYNVLGYKNADWENLLVFKLKNEIDADTIDKFLSQLKKIPIIVNATIFSQIPHLNKNTCRIKDVQQGENGKKKTNLLYIDHNYLSTVKMNLTMGRNFSESFSGDKTGAFLVNEKLCKEMKWKMAVGNAITVTLSTGETQTGRIIGVLANTMDKITPATIYKIGWAGNGFLAILASKSKEKEVLEIIKTRDTKHEIFKNFELIPVDMMLRRNLAAVLK